jgi:DNA-binding transcriptional regulator YiaG
MTENKKTTGIAEIISENNRRFLRLAQIFPDGSLKHVDCMEIPKVRKNSLLGQPRFLDASLLNVQQRTDELYTKDNHIA